MRHFKTVTVQARTEEQEDFTTCDLCKQRIPDEERYAVNEVEVRHKTGSSYPDGGDGEEIEVDMCGQCFDMKLVPWLREQGVNVQWKKWDW